MCRGAEVRTRWQAHPRATRARRSAADALGTPSPTRRRTPACCSRCARTGAPHRGARGSKQHAHSRASATCTIASLNAAFTLASTEARSSERRSALSSTYSCFTSTSRSCSARMTLAACPSRTRTLFKENHKEPVLRGEGPRCVRR
jgi:hypothetical protein